MRVRKLEVSPPKTSYCRSNDRLKRMKDFAGDRGDRSRPHLCRLAHPERTNPRRRTRLHGLIKRIAHCRSRGRCGKYTPPQEPVLSVGHRHSAGVAGKRDRRAPSHPQSRRAPPSYDKTRTGRSHQPVGIGMIYFLLLIGSMLPPRWLPQKSLPPYAYLPGKNPHPVRDPTGHSYHVEPIPVAAKASLSSDAFLWGLELFNHGYYWEAHEAW